jgi:hypothetical protein
MTTNNTQSYAFTTGELYQASRGASIEAKSKYVIDPVGQFDLALQPSQTIINVIAPWLIVLHSSDIVLIHSSLFQDPSNPSWLTNVDCKVVFRPRVSTCSKVELLDMAS